MTLKATLGATEVVLEYSGLLESRARKRASPVNIPISSIERVERVDFGAKGGKWFWIRRYGQEDASPNLAFDPYAYPMRPEHEEFVARLTAVVNGEEIGPLRVPGPLPTQPADLQRVRPDDTGQPYETGRTSSSFDWLFGG